MKRTKVFVAVATILVLAALMFFARSELRSGPVQKQTRFVMSTYCTIQAPGGAEVLGAIGAALDRIEEVDAKFSAHNPLGPIHAFNTSGTPIDDPEIMGVVMAALDMARVSDGAFDITVEPLEELWGFYSDEPRLPEQESVKAVLEHVGWRKLATNGLVLTKLDPAVRIDLGGIAKGYAVDEAMKVLKARGIESALVDAGGDIATMGKSPRGAWKIGVRNPRGDGMVAGLDVMDSAVVSSGDYERYFELGGERYHHILDPKTGYPARALASVTVTCGDAMTADALSTAAFVLGMEKGLALLEDYPGAEGLLIGTNGMKRVTSGMAAGTE